jgi:hypothetical protein
VGFPGSPASRTKTLRPSTAMERWRMAVMRVALSQ